MRNINPFGKTKFVNRVILLIVAATFISCVNEVDEGEEFNDSQTSTETINYLALGDSYTIGQGVQESERWPNQLGEELRELDYDVGEIDIIARTGWTTNNLLRAIDNAEFNEYNLVSLLIGVNNQYQRRPFSSFGTELETLLNFSIETAGTSSRVFVVSIPDYGVTPFGSYNSEMIGREIDMYNEYISDRCQEKGIRFINITEISRELGSSDGALASDNLHPSGNQYKEWTNEILPIVIEILD